MVPIKPIYKIDGKGSFLIFNENRYLSNWFYLGFGLIILAVVLHTIRILKPLKEMALSNP